MTILTEIGYNDRFSLKDFAKKVREKRMQIEVPDFIFIKTKLTQNILFACMCSIDGLKRTKKK